MLPPFPLLAELPQLNADQLAEMLTLVARLALPAILIAFGIHLIYFLFLWTWYRRDIRNIASALDSFTRDVRFRSVLDRNSHLCDQIEAFLSDIDEVLDKPDRKADRAGLSHRIHVLDEKRVYLQSMGFETAYNVCRTMIETYPIAGILGTIVASRVLGLAGFGIYATALAAAGFFQVLLDLTVAESLTKYGFRYVTREDWGRLRRRGHAPGPAHVRPPGT